MMTHTATSTIQILRILLAAALLTLAPPAAGAEPDTAAAAPTNGVAPLVAVQGTHATTAFFPSDDSQRPAGRDIPSRNFLIPVVMIIMGCSIPIVAIWCNYRKRHELLRMCHAERIAMIEKGLEPPPLPEELLRDHEDPDEGQDDAKPKTPSPTPGIMWTLIGIGVLIWLWFSPGITSPSSKSLIHPSIAAIPIAIGVACFIGFLYERKKKQP